MPMSMSRPLKARRARALRITACVGLGALGLIGLVIPILPGIPLLIVAGLLLSSPLPIERRR